MPRGVKASTTAKPARKVTAPKTIAKPRPAAVTRRAPAAAPAPKVSKEELRTQIEKLERANATLRAKNKEAVRAARASAAEVAELEERIAALEQQIAARPAKATPEPAATAAKKTGRGRPRTRVPEPDEEEPPLSAAEAPEPDVLSEETPEEAE